MYNISYLKYYFFIIFRPISHRDAVKAFPVRPLLSSTANKGPRKSSAAQTDISALPNHWRSDTHLAKKVSLNYIFI